MVYQDILHDHKCFIRQSLSKTLEHIFFWWPHACAVWHIGPCSYKPDLVGFPGFEIWWEILLIRFHLDIEGPRLLTLVILTL